MASRAHRRTSKAATWSLAVGISAAPVVWLAGGTHAAETRKLRVADSFPKATIW